MKLVAGIDIGNATTETALARLEGGRAVFLASGTVPTTGIKGTRQNINGIFHSLNAALERPDILLSSSLRCGSMRPPPSSVMWPWRPSPRRSSRNPP